MVWGEEELVNTLNFVEQGLGTDLESYLVKVFWKEHCKRYQKRPIYWLFASPKAAAARFPTVVIGSVRNKSHEHINVETFIKDMERALINSGKVDFVANAEERFGPVQVMFTY